MDSPLPLSETNVALKLPEIRKRCSELMEEPEALTDLSLVDPDAIIDTGDPYNHLKQPTTANSRQRCLTAATVVLGHRAREYLPQNSRENPNSWL